MSPGSAASPSQTLDGCARRCSKRESADLVARRRRISRRLRFEGFPFAGLSRSGIRPLCGKRFVDHLDLVLGRRVVSVDLCRLAVGEPEEVLDSAHRLNGRGEPRRESVAQVGREWAHAGRAAPLGSAASPPIDRVGCPLVRLCAAKRSAAARAAAKSLLAAEIAGRRRRRWRSCRGQRGATGKIRAACWTGAALMERPLPCWVTEARWQTSSGFGPVSRPAVTRSPRPAHGLVAADADARHGAGSARSASLRSAGPEGARLREPDQSPAVLVPELQPHSTQAVA